MQPEILTTESLRDYVLALPDRDRWIHLGVAYAPRQLMANFARTPCDLYVVPISEVPGFTDAPVEVLTLNERFFAKGNVGLTAQQTVWEIVEVHSLPPLADRISTPFRG